MLKKEMLAAGHGNHSDFLTPPNHSHCSWWRQGQIGKSAVNKNWSVKFMKIVFSALVTTLAPTMLSQDASSIRITQFDPTGLLQFTNNLVASNISYRIEYATSLPGDWQADTNTIIFGTNMSSKVQLNLPQTPTQLFVRVARNLFVASVINQSNIFESIALEDGERVDILTNSTLTAAYTGTNGLTDILYFSTNGLPDKVVDGQYVFLFRNFTSNSVDVGVVWPAGSNTIVRAVPVDAALMTRLQEFVSLMSSDHLPGITQRTKGTFSLDNLRNFGDNLAKYLLTAMPVLGCAGGIALAAGTDGGASPLLPFTCASATFNSISYITGNKVAGLFGASAGVIKTVLCTEAVAGDWTAMADCLPTVLTTIAGQIGQVGQEAETTKQMQSVPIRNTDATLQSSLTQTPAGMVWIPPGDFIMGSPDTEAERVSSEGPQTLVTISKGFWMGKYEVTQGEYSSLMGSNPSYFQGDLGRPVEMVSWNDAGAYAVALSARERSVGRLPTGYVYRLPTEAEWEYACRAGTTTAFHYGPSLRSGMANFDGQEEYDASIGSTSNPSGIYLGRTTSVGSYAPNQWGLYDMHGNVLEWCQDWWWVNLPGGSVIDPIGPSTGELRVLRGGCWSYRGSGCRSAVRHHYYQGTSWFDWVGFRVVLVPGQP